MVAGRSLAKAIALALFPGCLCGQTVRGLVTDQASKLPVAGVIIQLVDAGGASVSRALTNESGGFSISAPAPGTYRVRTLRIGFRPQTSSAVRLAAGETVELPLTLASLPVSLDTVRVAGRNACVFSGDTVVATYAIWEQVRGALTAAQLTAAANELTTHAMAYERVMDPTFRGVRRQSTTFARSLTARPWQSMSADSLRRIGYVMDDLTGGRIFLAPDLEVLLSAEFMEDHCLRLSRSSTDSTIGIEFEPSRDRRSIPEIRGTVWVDRATAELRSMDFRYDNLSFAEADARPGGQMEFLRLKGGAWVILRWNIRMPVVVTEMERSGSRSGVRTAQQRVTEIRVAGGELVSVLTGEDTTWARASMSLSGTVVDSASRGEVEGARVVLRGTSLSATTGKDGRFFIANLLPGEYGVDVRTASLDSVGGTYSTALTFGDPNAKFRIAVPSGDAYAGEFCPSAADSTKVSAFLLGTVRLEGDTTPPWNVEVSAQWEDGKASKTVLSRTDATGRYRMCGLPVGRDISIRSELDDTLASPVRVRVPGRKRFAVADIAVAKPAVQVGVMFAGSVLADGSREPLSEAEVLIAALGIAVRTNAQGRFRVSGIPAGTHRVSARKVGYAAVETDVTFSAQEPVARQFHLGRVAALNVVTVTARPLLPGFEERLKRGIGQYMTRAELAKKEGSNMSSILTELPGVDLMSGPGGRRYLRTSRVNRNPPPPLGLNQDNIFCVAPKLCQCWAQVYVDNMLMNPGRPTPAFDVNSWKPEQIEAIEYYASTATLPMEFARRGATCGVFVIWMRRSKL
jgi:hypothetical protein